MMPRKYTWLLIIPLLLLSSGLTAFFLTSDALWFDEIMTYFIVGLGKFEPRTLRDIIFLTAIDNSWPPAYFLLVFVWNGVIGSGLLFDRILPMFLGLISIAVMYRLGKSIFNTRTGLYASILIATSAFYLFYFHEIRGYTLYILTGQLHLLAYSLLLKPTYYARRRYRWFYALALIFAIYSHYIAVVSVGVLGLYHLLVERKNQNWLGILKLTINAGLSFTPWLAVMIVSIYNHSTVDWSSAYSGALGASFIALSNGLIILVIPVLLSSLVDWRKNRTIPMLWFWVIGIVGFITLGNMLARFIFHPRHFIILLIPCLLLIAHVMERLDKIFPALTFGIALLWVGAGIFYSADQEFMAQMPSQYRTVPLQTMNTALHIAESCIQPDDAVVLEFWHENEITSQIHNTSFYYYFHDFGFSFAQLSRMELIDSLFVNTPLEIDYQTRVEEFIQGSETIWLMVDPTYPVFDQMEVFEQTVMDQGYVDCGIFQNSMNFLGKAYSQSLNGCQQIIQTCYP